MTRLATPMRGPDSGRRAVELWGGIADRRTRRSWNRDTAALMFSCTKGVLAVCVYRLDARARQLTLALGRVVGA